MRFPSIFITSLSLFILSPSNLYYSPRIQISIYRHTDNVHYLLLSSKSSHQVSHCIRCTLRNQYSEVSACAWYELVIVTSHKITNEVALRSQFYRHELE